ncbi:hypothetical protein K502DRAFT_323280 [Neoconidiobolus thromboides FSU 785]|nr:hypothetical protein K502DRAFT_323280 [Neoconidiobolus thromboides FSU 785]
MEEQLEVVYAIHEFDASVEDEISLIAGEKIWVIEKDELYNDGWWQGKNSRGEVGLFPMNFISYKDPNQNNPGVDRYANLLLENEEQASNNKKEYSKLGGRLSDPINEDAKRDSFQNFIQEEGLSHYDSREGSNYSPLAPALILNNATNNNDTNNNHNNIELNNNNDNLIRHNSTKVRSNQNITDNEGHKRTFTSNNPLTPNRSSFRNSVRLSHIDDVHTDPSQSHPKLWSNNEVCDWLERAGFQSVISLFKEHEITGKELTELDLNTLKDIGILAFGKRFNLNNSINSLKVKYNITSLNHSDSTKNNMDHVYNMYSGDSNLTSPIKSDISQNNNVTEQINKDRDIYPVEERKPTNLESSLKNLNLNNNIENPNSHSHIEKWLQQTPDFDYDHDLLKEAGISSPSDLQSILSGKSKDKEKEQEESGSESNESSNEEEQEESNYNEISPAVSSKSPTLPNNALHNNSLEYKFPAFIPKTDNQLKKQVSFSQNLPEVIGTSEIVESDNESEDENQMSLTKKASLSASKLFNNEKRKVPPSNKAKNGIDNNNNDHTFNIENNKSYTVEPDTTNNYISNGDDSTITVQGSLKKQEGAIKLWKSRYCVLNGTDLKIYDTFKLKKLKLSINLKGYKPVLDPNLNPGKYCFKLVHQHNKSHYFCSDEAEEIRAWMKALMKISIDRDTNAPVVTSCTVNTVPLHVARKLAPRPPSAMYSNGEEEED